MKTKARNEDMCGLEFCYVIVRKFCDGFAMRLFYFLQHFLDIICSMMYVGNDSRKRNE
jgi:hypothetical protein